MYNIGDYVVYKREVCEITDIKVKYIKDKDYYCMRSIRDKTLGVSVPTDSNLIRNILSKEEALNIINYIDNIDYNYNEDRFDNECKELMKTDKIEDLIKIIKMSHKRCEDRINQGKKVGDRDNDFIKKCEDIFYIEMSLALSMSYDDVVEFIKGKVLYI